MLPTFMHTIRYPKRPADQPAMKRVRLLSWPMHLRPHCFEIGSFEGTVSDEVLVRFGEIVVQVPPEMVESVEEEF